MKAKRSGSSRRSARAACPERKRDYGKARPNRFAGHAGKDCTVVVLDTDVSKVFATSESVNTALRAFIAAMPKRPR